MIILFDVKAVFLLLNFDYKKINSIINTLLTAHNKFLLTELINPIKTS